MFTKYVFFSIVHFIAVIIAFKILGFISPGFLISYYISIVNFATVLLVSKSTFTFTKRRFLNEKVHSSKGAVLITGCDTGFGHLLAKRLDSKGFGVFASCYFPEGEGAKELKKSCSKRLEVLGLDVTKDESVAEAFKYVSESLGKSDLWAIVNNAGINKGTSLDYSSIQDFQDTMNVNSLGPVRVTKTFLPLLRKCKGRVVNITSIAGRGHLPMLLAYFMSKYAAVAFNGCLRQELDLWGISVVSVEPEFFSTEIYNKEKNLELVSSAMQFASSDTKKYLSEAYEKHILKFITDVILRVPSPKVHLVVDDLEDAVTSVHPDVTYRPRRSVLVRFICFVFTASPENVQDKFVKIGFWLFGFSKALKQK